MQRLILAVLAGTLALGGCGRLSFDRRATPQAELPYRTDMKVAEDGTLMISVKAMGAGVAEVRESVRYEATRYCLANTGTSTADWVLDAQGGDWAYSQSEDELVFQARCRG